MTDSVYSVEVTQNDQGVLAIVNQLVAIPATAAQTSTMLGYPTYIQASQPTALGPWVWWQTVTGGKFSLWINDGVGT